MSDRTHQYRLLGRRDPAITTQVYGVDPATGETHPLASTSDGKLVVEVSGGGGGGSSIIQGVDSGGTPHDVLVETDGKLIVDVASAPVIQAEGPGGPVDLTATVDARLLVQTQDDATVAIRAVGPLGLTDLQTSSDGLLVDVSPGVVLPVESPTGLLVKGVDDAAAEHPLKVSTAGELQVGVVGIAEVKATSANFWALSKGDGPVVIPGFTDADGWFNAQAFSRFSAAGMSAGYTWDEAEGFVARSGTVHRVETYAELTAAITAAAANDVILLRDGTYEVPSGTLTVNKSLVLIGESRDGVVIQTPVQAAPGVTSVVTISANNVELRNLTVHHRQTASSGGGLEACVRMSAAFTGIVLDTVRLRYMEWGFVGWGQFTVRSCAFDYELGALSNSHRAIGTYGLSGTCQVLDCTAIFGTNASTSQGRFFATFQTAGSDYSGDLIIARCTQVSGRCNSLLYLENLPGTASALDVAILDCAFQAEATNMIVIANADTLGEVTLSGNSFSQALKGAIGFDVAKTLPLVLHESGNTVTDPTIRVDYVSIYGTWIVTARNTVSPVPAVTADAIIPDFGLPAESGGSLLLEDHISVDVDYRISMAEPHSHILASGNLNSAYHQIQNPEQPADILGIGHLRLRGHSSADRGGYFAVFGSAK